MAIEIVDLALKNVFFSTRKVTPGYPESSLPGAGQLRVDGRHWWPGEVGALGGVTSYVVLGM